MEPLIVRDESAAPTHSGRATGLTGPGGSSGGPIKAPAEPGCAGRLWKIIPPPGAGAESPDVPSLASGRGSELKTRGWVLQVLLGPCWDGGTGVGTSGNPPVQVSLGVTKRVGRDPKIHLIPTPLCPSNVPETSTQLGPVPELWGLPQVSPKGLAREGPQTSPDSNPVRVLPVLPRVPKMSCQLHQHLPPLYQDPVVLSPGVPYPAQRWHSTTCIPQAVPGQVPLQRAMSSSVCQQQSVTQAVPPRQLHGPPCLPQQIVPRRVTTCVPPQVGVTQCVPQQLRVPQQCPPVPQQQKVVP
ncbi:hypothetical protein DV515_00018482, partial [Chloebia gouldiae]